MKRSGYLMERIADPDNLRLAYWKARRGKDTRPDVGSYRRCLSVNLHRLRDELLSGEIDAGHYRYFRIYDPKERIICAASFPERVLHHAVMNVCHPIFERFQIHDSYATRPGKGQYAALDRVKSHVRHYRWFCKLDIRKFFDSIDHERLFGLLCRMYKDPVLLGIFRQLIDSYETESGKGLPIGNLTSQYLANYYLAYADHHAKEKLRVSAYVRYMDDMLLFHDDRSELVRISKEFAAYIEVFLCLRLKTPCINSTDKGVPFLGYVLFPESVRLNKNSKKRYKKKMRIYESKLTAGEWTETDYARHITPLVAFTRYADATCFRRSQICRMGAG